MSVIRLGSLAGYPFDGPRLLVGWTPPESAAVYAITYKPDPLSVAIVESWPHEIIDSDAKRDWDWKPTHDLDRMLGEIIGVFKHESVNE